MPALAEPPASKPRRLAFPKAATAKVKAIDALADLVIRIGGIGIILLVALIFVFIAYETLPLFLKAKKTLVHEGLMTGLGTDEKPLVLGGDEYENFAYFLSERDNQLHFLKLNDWSQGDPVALPSLALHPASAAYRSPSKDHLFIGTRDGQVLLAHVRFDSAYDGGVRTTKYAAAEDALVPLPPGSDAVKFIHGRADSEGALLFAGICENGTKFYGKWTEDEGVTVQNFEGKIDGNPTAITTDYEGDKIFISTDAGRLYQWYLADDAHGSFHQYNVAYDPANPQATAKRFITAMDTVIGDNDLVLGFNDGTVQGWIGVRETPTDTLKIFQPVQSFDRLPAAITAIVTSGRDKGFAIGAADGTVHLKFTTSMRTLLDFKLNGAITRILYYPKLTSILALSDRAETQYYSVKNPHPQISFHSLFGKVHYEGYDEPQYIWQSTGGTDDFEEKLSLVPLALGTLKGAFYGLLFAIPIAVAAALYTSQFMHWKLRTYVKPTVEIMAALPSVVIGFLAGLWFAPLLEKIMVGTLLLFFVIPLMVMGAVLIWNGLPKSIRDRAPVGAELGILIVCVLGGFFLSQALGPFAETILFGGNVQQFVFNFFGQQLDQRNCIVIGFAMAFAVIPIIFTISEDAFSNVPKSFQSASYALGASRWQTAFRVILPTASPGVFSAVMIGFGRAVGETMIVLMATGNTPIMSFSPFNGFRSLSANIAVEIPEAPQGATLYRVLFVAALLLFLLTFAVNTVAELVRQHLREKYKAV